MDSEHISSDIKKVTDYLEEKKIKYIHGPIGTSIQGEWDEIMPIVQECHRMVVEGHSRVLTNIIIDDHKDSELDIEDAMALS